MRININFTVDVDPEKYRQVEDENIKESDIRKAVKRHIRQDAFMTIADKGWK